MVLLASENKRTTPILEDLILRTIRIKATKSRRSAVASFTLCASLVGKISFHGVMARKGGWVILNIDVYTDDQLAPKEIYSFS